MKASHEAATVLASELFPLIELHARTHGADKAVVEGLWALANLAALLISSPGVKSLPARAGFIKALDLCIAEEATGDSETKH